MMTTKKSGFLLRGEEGGQDRDRTTSRKSMEQGSSEGLARAAVRFVLHVENVRQGANENFSRYILVQVVKCFGGMSFQLQQPGFFLRFKMKILSVILQRSTGYSSP